MRTLGAVLAVAVAVTWSVEARAQLQPPPIQPQPAPAWGPPPQQSATVQHLNAGDQSGSFRRLELVYLNADVGAAYANPGSGQGGVAFGLGVGLRFVTWTLGIRGRISPMSAFTFYEGNLELGFHVPMGAWDPYVNVHGGYARASMNNVDTLFAVPVIPASPSGGDVGGSVGIDYYLAALFSLGVDATADALFLGTPDTTAPVAGATIILAHGQSITGSFLMGSVHAGLHFDL
jgi:hypothetical protein